LFGEKYENFSEVVLLFQATCLLVKSKKRFFESDLIVLDDLSVSEKYENFSEMVQLFQVICSMVKITRIFGKWSNCSK